MTNGTSFNRCAPPNLQILDSQLRDDLNPCHIFPVVIRKVAFIKL